MKHFQLSKCYYVYYHKCKTFTLSEPVQFFNLEFKINTQENKGKYLRKTCQSRCTYKFSGLFTTNEDLYFEFQNGKRNKG